MSATESRISHVCISDLHAGALSSVVTRLDDKLGYDPGEPSATSAAFGPALAKTLQVLNAGEAPPDLVLLGDALEMAASPPARSCAVLGTFLTALYVAPELLSDRILFVPGNHDHAIWTAERYAALAVEAGTAAPRLEGDSHVSRAFAPPSESRHRSRLLEQILSAVNLKNMTAPTYYPNLGLRTADGRRAVVFHHGHFIEAMYRVMSDLVTLLSGRGGAALTCETLEKYNGSWIDFGWSTLGDDGLLGEDATIAYQLLLTGGEADGFQGRLARLLARTVSDTLALPATTQIQDALAVVARGFVDATVGKFSQLERYSYTQVLSPDSVAGLKSYLSDAVLPQMSAELPGLLPERTTFVFGHTHKPFEDQVVAEGFAGPVGVYNTGGWILDTSLLSTVEGASAVFVDEALNTAALRLFTMPVNDSVPQVAVTTADIGPNPLVGRLENAVAAASRGWTAFSQAAAADFRQRQQKILEMTHVADARRRGGVL